MSRVATAIRRAGNCCEYCRLSQLDISLTFHIDHVLPQKHQGSSELHNLSLSCADCNAYKGSDLSSIDPSSGEITPLFNPRQHHWSEHFVLVDATVEGLTAQGRATVMLLRLNSPERVEKRAALIELGSYPCNPPQGIL